jgi:glycosyltransferase involved in cell wall biosynthesis
MQSHNIWLVIPAFNEAAVIQGTVTEAIRYFPNIVVVDDCSTDGTGVISMAAGSHLCRHPVNLGQGASLQTGIDYALRKGATIIVTFDADGQHSPSDAVAMVELLIHGSFDVVLGSRFLGSMVGASFQREALLKLATVFTRVSTGLQITDAHNGLRVLSRSAAKTIRIRHNRMAHASGILDQIAKHKLRYTECPCTITYTNYSKSKGQKMTGALAILTDLIVRRLYN